MVDNKIWIVDDNEAVCDALRFLFDSFFSLNIKTYNNPLELLEELSPEWEGCLIIDLFMYYMNGFELTKKIKKLNGHLKIIIISGHGTRETEAQALEAGANAFITKPFQMDTLLNQVSLLLDAEGI